MLANVEEESIGAPATNKHYSEHGDVVKIHGHGTGGTVGMGANFVGGEAKGVFAHGGGVGPEQLKEGGGREAGEIARSWVNKGVHSGR